MSVIKLVSKQEDAFVFDVEALREKLAIYADHKIAVISIAGAFRTGKSFLANWIIRYFELDRDENWLDSQGFTIFGCKKSEQFCFGNSRTGYTLNVHLSYVRLSYFLSFLDA